MGFTVAELLGHSAKIFDDFPNETISIGGTTYTCQIESKISGNEFGEAGKKGQVGMRIIIKRSEINSAIPDEGTSAVFDGTTYEIGNVTIDDDGANIVAELRTKT